MIIIITFTNYLYKVHLKHVSDQQCVFNYKLIMFVHHPVYLFYYYYL